MAQTIENLSESITENTLDNLKCDVSAILIELKENDIQIFNMLSEILSLLQTFLPARKVK